MNKIYAFLLAVAAMACGHAAASDVQDWNGSAPRSTADLKAPVRIINLWATWCGPCRKEMPEMSAWYKKQKKGSVDMVGIALDSSENIGRFLRLIYILSIVVHHCDKSPKAVLDKATNKGI